VNPAPPVPPEFEVDAEGELHNVFGGEIPEAERAWRRLEEFPDDPAAAIQALRSAVEALPEALRALRAEVRTTMESAKAVLQSPRGATPTTPDALRQTVEALPGMLQQLRDEIRQASAATREAVQGAPAGASAPGTESPGSPAMAIAVRGLREELNKTGERLAAFDPGGLARTLGELQKQVRDAAARTAAFDPAAITTALGELQKQVREAAAVRTPAYDFAGLGTTLRQLRDEMREATIRSTDVLASTRTAADAVPSLVTTMQDEFARLTATLREGMAASNAEAARAFALVAREVRALGDRQAVLREEVRLLGKRLEEMERSRRRQGVQRPQSPARVKPAERQTD
jgi:hypothetical protein